MKIDEAFDEVRSLMQREQLDEEQRAELWEMMRRAHAQAPERYRDQWLPYVRSFERHFRAPIATVRDVASLAEGAAIAPHAHFEFLFEDGTLRAATLYKLLAAAEARRLGALIIVNKKVTAKMLSALNSPQLSSLHTLNLERARLGMEGAKALARAEHLSSLRALHVKDNGIGVKGAKALVQSPHLTLAARARSWRKQYKGLGHSERSGTHRT